LALPSIACVRDKHLQVCLKVRLTVCPILSFVSPFPLTTYSIS
jgi:hypothetical protein